jgi:N-methylhydantoinase A
METVGVSLAIDIGGTFTDIVARKGRSVYVKKTLTTHENLLTGFMSGVAAVLEQAGAKAEDVTDGIFHATTVVTNALIERKGAATALVCTDGFADVLEIRDERRYDMYDPQIEFPKPLVARDNVFSIRERTAADGSVLTPVADEEIERLATWLDSRAIRSVGVCLLHSYKNPANEQHIARVLKKLRPEVFVSLSSDVASQIREYLRASTTAANAYAVPITQPYLDELESRLKETGYPSRPLIILSSGGAVAAATAGRLPIRMVESGPAAGALGASFASRQLGLSDLLAFDMGGTTAKICLLQDHTPLISGSFEIDRMYRMKEGSGLPVTVPCVDMIEIGAGGGSIAHVSDMGLLNVGPQSAGSQPGPACYGRGGTLPTVTDADVLLAVVDAKGFLGGAMPLRTDLAAQAFEPLAASLGVSNAEAARGVVRVVCEAMAGAVRTHATERGVDYRGIPLLAFGGAGPVHACEVAELLRSSTVIFPPFASVYSAFGALVSPVRLDMVRSGMARVDRLDWSAVQSRFDEMEAEGSRALVEAGCGAEEIRFDYSADMRYCGQHSDLTVPLPGRPDPSQGAEPLRAAFEAAYMKRYRLTQPNVQVEVVNWRASAVRPNPSSPNATRHEGKPSPMRSRLVHLWRDNQEAAVYSRSALRAGMSIDGPAVIEEPETTIAIPPGWSAKLGEFECIVATRNVMPEQRQ